MIDYFKQNPGVLLKMIPNSDETEQNKANKEELVEKKLIPKDISLNQRT